MKKYLVATLILMSFIQAFASANFNEMLDAFKNKNKDYVVNHIDQLPLFREDKAGALAVYAKINNWINENRRLVIYNNKPYREVFQVSRLCNEVKKKLDYFMEDGRWDSAAFLLKFAAVCGHSEIIKSLVKSETVYVDETLYQFSFVGVTPLMEAAGNNRVEAVRVLIELGASIDKRDKNSKSSAIHHAISSNMGVESLKVLLGAGADVNRTAMGNQTPINKAALINNIEAAKILLEFDADIHILDYKGYSPIDNAKQRGNQEMAKLLETYNH